jgi:hypothetical protein
MSEEQGLVRKLRIGDITFGVPVGIELLNQPYGFYDFLEVSRTATFDEIKKAYRKLSFKLHPDHGGTDESFKSLERVVSILLDDGGDLGIEHSRRRHYDAVSEMDSYFDGFIQIGKERTLKLSEILLMQMEGAKKEAVFEREIEEKVPEYKEMKAELERARSDESRSRIMQDMQQAIYRANEMNPEMIERMHEVITEIQKRRNEEAQKFVRSFRKNPDEYYERVCDIFYLGDGTLTFSQYNQELYVAGHEVMDGILKLVLGGDSCVRQFSQVHVKAEQGTVALKDHNVKGIVHVVDGKITVCYDASSYGEVIRARAPQVYPVIGFEKHDDLYIPESFAVGNWWEKKPALDLAVMKGRISLELGSSDLGGLKKYMFLENNLDNILESKFNKNYISKKIK